MTKLLAVLLFSMMTISGWAQQYLYLKKGNQPPARRLGLYYTVKFRTVEDDSWMSGKLESISEESITINNVVYPLNEISAFRLHNELLYLGGTGVAGAGLLYIALAMVNNSINGNETLIYKGEAIGAASVVAAGVLMRLLSRKTYRAENGWKWVIIDLENN